MYTNKFINMPVTKYTVDMMGFEFSIGEKTYTGIGIPKSECLWLSNLNITGS